MSGSVFRIVSRSSTTLRVALMRRPLRQREIDEQLGTVGAREELLLHELHAEKRRKEETHGSGNHGVFLAQRPIEHGVESALKARRLMAVALQLVGKDEHAGQRREQHGDHPGDDERDRHDGEQREGILTGAACAKPTGTKPAIVTSVPVSIGKAVDV